MCWRAMEDQEPATGRARGNGSPTDKGPGGAFFASGLGFSIGLRAVERPVNASSLVLLPESVKLVLRVTGDQERHKAEFRKPCERPTFRPLGF